MVEINERSLRSEHPIPPLGGRHTGGGAGPPDPGPSWLHEDRAGGGDTTATTPLPAVPGDAARPGRHQRPAPSPRADATAAGTDTGRSPGSGTGSGEAARAPEHTPDPPDPPVPAARGSVPDPGSAGPAPPAPGATTAAWPTAGPDAGWFSPERDRADPAPDPRAGDVAWLTPRPDPRPAGASPWSTGDVGASLLGPGAPRELPTGPLPVTPPALPPLPTGPHSVATPLDHRSPVRYTGTTPADGWRGRLFTATRGRVNPGAGPAQVARQRLIESIRRPLGGPHRVAVMSVKGGVGKTTVAAGLGLVLAENRGDRVVALDANPDAGTLADRLTGITSVTVRDLLNSAEEARSLTDVDRFTSLAGRLQVLASEQDPAAGEAFSRAEYERVCAVLARFANILVTDSGTGLVHSAMEGTLALADGLVVVGSPTIDGASRAAKTLDWLASHGHGRHAAGALVVLSCDRWSRDVDRAAIRAHFAARCRGVVEIPYDPYLAMGGRIVLPALRQATVDAFLLLAALVAEGFAPPAPPRVRPPEPPGTSPHG